jgi:hypothetical protein
MGMLPNELVKKCEKLKAFISTLNDRALTLKIQQ